jgi:hypothetical protein
MTVFYCGKVPLTLNQLNFLINSFTDLHPYLSRFSLDYDISNNLIIVFSFKQYPGRVDLSNTSEEFRNKWGLPSLLEIKQATFDSCIMFVPIPDIKHKLPSDIAELLTTTA